MDISACGRQLFVNAQMSKARSLASMISQMEALDPANAALYKAANQYQTLTGNKHFWRSDFQVQRTPDYYFSVKMCSERVIGAESCNSENISGYYMGDGASYLVQSGKEYEDIFPYWDWKKIPGTTTQQENKVLPVLTASGYRLPSKFVGGVSDGKSGIAAMDYVRGGLTAHKAWFIFNNQIVCLGAGINSTAGLQVTTSVNQVYLNGETLMKAGSLKNVPQETSETVHPVWILQNNTGYFFPQGGNLQLETKTVEGSWNRVALMYKDEIIKSPIFKLWFDHGTNPQDQKYACILIPGADKTMMQKLEKSPSFTILKNEKDIQAVISSDKSLGGVIFYQPGAADLFGGVQAQDPCILMMKKVQEGIQVSVSDPTQKLEQIRLSIKGKYTSGEFKNGSTEITVNLPKGDEAGKTVTMILKK
jgi:chondroitin AC lyase